MLLKSNYVSRQYKPSRLAKSWKKIRCLHRPPFMTHQRDFSWNFPRTRRRVFPTFPRATFTRRAPKHIIRISHESVQPPTPTRTSQLVECRFLISRRDRFVVVRFFLEIFEYFLHFAHSNFAAAAPNTKKNSQRFVACDNETKWKNKSKEFEANVRMKKNSTAEEMR